MLVVIGVALVVRVAWAVSVGPRTPSFDEADYVRHAHDLAAGRGYVDGEGNRTAYWPIGYPVALAAGYRIIGPGPLAAISLQIVASIATCLLVFILGSSTFGATTGRLAALMLAVYPTHVFYSTLHLTEPLFTLLLTAALMLLLKSLRFWPCAVFAGLVLGLAILVRPFAVLLPAVLLVWYWKQMGRRRAGVLALVTACAAVAAVSPWLARNHSHTGSWTVLSTTGGHDFWIGNHPGAFGGYRYPHDIMAALHDSELSDYSRGYRLGLENVLDRPLDTIVRTFRKVSYFYALETDGALWNLKGLSQPAPMPVTLALLALANTAYIAVLALTVLGLLATPRGQPLSTLFLTITAYFLFIVVVFLGDPRYHYALVPAATIFAAKALLHDLPAVVGRANRPLLRRWCAVVAGLLLLMAANLAIKRSELERLPSAGQDAELREDRVAPNVGVIVAETPNDSSEKRSAFTPKPAASSCSCTQDRSQKNSSAISSASSIWPAARSSAR